MAQCGPCEFAIAGWGREEGRQRAGQRAGQQGRGGRGAGQGGGEGRGQGRGQGRAGAERRFGVPPYEISAIHKYTHTYILHACMHEYVPNNTGS